MKSKPGSYRPLEEQIMAVIEDDDEFTVSEIQRALHDGFSISQCLEAIGVLTRLGKLQMVSRKPHRWRKSEDTQRTVA